MLAIGWPLGPYCVDHHMHVLWPVLMNVIWPGPVPTYGRARHWFAPPGSARLAGAWSALPLVACTGACA